MSEKTAFDVMRERNPELLPRVGDVLSFPCDDGTEQYARVTGWTDDEHGLVPALEWLDGPPDESERLAA